MWKEFKKQKLAALKKAIHLGKVDEGIIPLLNEINKYENLVTTSSCFGRIVLLEFDLKERKATAEFYRKWHREVSVEEVEAAVSEYNKKLPLWFKVEPFILHVSAADYKSAEWFLKVARAAGVKRGGIQGTNKGKVAIEIQGTVWMSFPIDCVTAKWKEVVNVANKMVQINFLQLKKLEKLLK
ncbi:MAG: hypothetical protein QXF35_03685 [Candidatus Bilamarchaeaceae archaeon]